MNESEWKNREQPAFSGRKHSVRTQLILWNIVALAILLGILGGVIHYTVESFLIDSVDRELDRRLQRVGDHPDPPPGPHPDGFQGVGQPPFMDDRRRDGGGPPIDFNRPEFDHRPPGFRANDPYHPHKYDLDGKSRDPVDSRAPWDMNALKRASSGQDVTSSVVENDEPLQILSRPLFDRGQVIGVAQAAYPLTDINRAISGMNRALLMLIPVGLLGAGMGGAYLTDRVLRRVRKLTQAADHISALKFSDRLPVTGNDEFSELASTFNGLLGRLESAYTRQEQVLEQQRRFTADASHELKTPLTIIKGTASMILSTDPDKSDYRESLQEIDRAASSMSTLVQDLLILARSDEGHSSSTHIELLLKEIIIDAVKGVNRIPGAEIKVDFADDSLRVRGNESELVRLFTNLLDNALHYTPAEGSISVLVYREGSFAVIKISDTGIGMEAKHLPHLGERFYRIDSSRTRPTGGTGLGLSICKNIVQIHYGSINFESKPGAGTTVTVALPLSIEE